MKRLLAVQGAAALILGGLVAAPAHAVDECLQTPVIGVPADGGGNVAPLTSTDGQAELYLVFGGEGYPDAYCLGTTATVQKTDGSLRRTATFTEHTGTGHPPALWVLGRMPIPLANGAGDWVVTSVAHGTESRAVSVPFHVRRGTVATIDPPARVTSPAKTTIAGVVRNYTSIGALAASPGRTVQLLRATTPGNPEPLLGTIKTDSAGRYKFQLAISAPVSFRTTVLQSLSYGPARTDAVTARVLASLSPLSASPRAYIGRWWGVSGTAFPTRLLTHLLRWDSTQWVSTNSVGTPAATGAFTRWWKPTTAGGYRMRVELSGSGPDNTPLSREIGVTVTARPAYITGTAGATNAAVIRPGTKMSTYGHLTAMYTTGKTGPFAGQKVVVQTRPRGTTQPYVTVATATTASNGYYYANWTIRNDVDVRVAFISPYQSVGSAFRYVRAVDVR